MSKPKILAVDDQPENLRIIVEILKRDFAIIAATSGEKALQLIDDGLEPVVILLDVLMPGLSGFEVCEHLKSKPQTSSYPILFVTGRDEEADFEQGLSLGAYDFIQKPVSPALLINRLRHCIYIGK